MSRDPLVTHGVFEYRREPRWGEHIYALRSNPDVYVCDEGVYEWFDVKRHTQRFALTISPYARPEAYYLTEDLPRRRGVAVLCTRPDAQRLSEWVSFTREAMKWFRVPLRRYPQYQFYVSMEVPNENQRSGSRICSARKLHATSA